jgi:hypothetical protein
MLFKSKYHFNEQEYLTMVWMFKKYRTLLEDNLFTLHTDKIDVIWLDKVQGEQEKLI